MTRTDCGVRQPAIILFRQASQTAFGLPDYSSCEQLFYVEKLSGSGSKTFELDYDALVVFTTHGHKGEHMVFNSSLGTHYQSNFASTTAICWQAARLVKKHTPFSITWETITAPPTFIVEAYHLRR